jgi:hypothetical protein
VSFPALPIRFTPAALFATGTAVAALVAACFIAVGRAALREVPVYDGTPEASHLRRPTVFWLAALFLGVFSGKLLLMRGHPVTTPFWDQWDGEARLLIIPFKSGTLSWAQMFDLHNEHRIFFTRLLSLLLLTINGQWDPRLEQVVNAAIHTSTAVGLAGALWIVNQRRHFAFFGLVTAVCFIVPFAWENTLFGFQSAFYFQLLFSVLAMWMTSLHEVGSGTWYLGWVCALFALFTAAGGTLTAVSIAAVACCRAVRDPGGRRGAATNAAIATVLMWVGFSLMSPSIPQHAFLRVTTPREFVDALGRDLSWPWLSYPYATIALWAPLGVWALGTVSRGAAGTSLEWFLLNLGVWTLLQAGAIAYGRGAGAPAPSPRYQDFLSLGFLANACALVVCMDWALPGSVARRSSVGLAVGWLCFAIVGAAQLARRSFAEIDASQPFWAAHAANVRRFVARGDLAEFLAKQPLNELPYPDARTLADMLQQPVIRSILPAAVREPVQLIPHVLEGGAFVRDGWPKPLPGDPLRPGWGTDGNRGVAAIGRLESYLIPPCERGTYLDFPVAGTPGRDQLFLALRGQGRGRQQEVAIDQLEEGKWSNVLVPCPRQRYSVISEDRSVDRWFAFQAPVEVGWASKQAEALIAGSPLLMFVAVAMALFPCVWIRWT